LIRFCIILLFCTIINRDVFAESNERAKKQNADTVTKIEPVRNRRGNIAPPNVAPPSPNVESNVLPQIANDLLSREQQLVFGLITLNRRQNIFGDDGRAYYLRELLKITGFSPEEAKQIINKYKENPKKWLATLQEISNILTLSGTQNNE
jgi:hypothetical protein